MLSYAEIERVSTGEKLESRIKISILLFALNFFYLAVRVEYVDTIYITLSKEKETTMSQVTFVGESGKKYSFLIQPMTTLFKEIGAVYFITNRATDEMNKVVHNRIFVGETDNLAKRFDQKIDSFFKKYKANCICILLEEDGKLRKKIESDLVGNYNPPCNV